ncbi:MULTISPECIES: histidine kinase dimerization/phospho-acceptor domain-containing protein [unclassified Acidovorax]|uniref:histidine kinase dimerization/phospho-acceptor domain-containing protein n=1 Tax=unclassified Acidovorax TaxID=2684926 RepID=UPI002882F598|nr:MULTISPECIES: histidine kinase dimerization/phospho-acceptor domain-containing protein [unclassified Acidovorax]
MPSVSPSTETSAPPAALLRRQPSLTWRLLYWTLGALVLVWASFVAMAYQTGVHEADELTDGHLASVAALLLNLAPGSVVDSARATQRTDMPWLKAHDYQQSLSVSQWDATGRLLTHTGSAPLPPFEAPEGFADLQLGQPSAPAWRAFSQWDAARERKIMVLLDLQERDDLADDIAGQMVEPGLWLLPVVALALGLAVRRGLRPLYSLSGDVAALDVAGAQRLAARTPLREFAPVVASINTLLDRQQAVLERERRLANEVAHELRTPLSSIVLNANALAGGLPADQHAQALDRIAKDALRAGHVLNQLLALARTSRTRLQESETVDLAALARSVGADYAQAAWEHGGSIAVTAESNVTVRGNAVLLELALRNLVENALRHTPAGTRIEVQAGPAALRAEAGMAAWLQVCDDGSRAGAAPCAPPVDSLHLGHEIVARVAQVHGGQFGPAAAPAPFTTCWRMTLANSADIAAG